MRVTDMLSWDDFYAAVLDEFGHVHNGMFTQLEGYTRILQLIPQVDLPALVQSHEKAMGDEADDRE